MNECLGENNLLSKSPRLLNWHAGKPRLCIRRPKFRSPEPPVRPPPNLLKLRQSSTQVQLDQFCMQGYYILICPAL